MNNDQEGKNLFTYMKKLIQNPSNKQDFIDSEAKLQSLGHVNFVINLTKKQKELLRTNTVQNFIPWRAV